jgi:hypothetical protein
MEFEFLKDIEPLTWGIVSLVSLAGIGLFYLFKKSGWTKYLP